MTLPLIVLAVLSIIRRFIGLPSRKVGTCSTSFWPRSSRRPPLRAHGAQEGHYPVIFEIIMMGVSLVIAGIGILFAYRCIFRNLGCRITWRKNFGVPITWWPISWVDELYDWVFVGPLIRFSVFLWRKSMISSSTEP